MKLPGFFCYFLLESCFQLLKGERFFSCKGRVGKVKKGKNRNSRDLYSGLHGGVHPAGISCTSVRTNIPRPLLSVGLISRLMDCLKFNVPTLIERLKRFSRDAAGTLVLISWSSSRTWISPPPPLTGT